MDNKRTDKETGRILITRPRLHSMQRGNNKHVFDKELSKSLCFNNMHHVQKKITCF